MYVSFLTIALEIWMLVRQTVSKIIPKCLNGMDLFAALQKYTTIFWLVLLAGLALALFSIYCTYHKNGHMKKVVCFTPYNRFGLCSVHIRPVT